MSALLAGPVLAAALTAAGQPGRSPPCPLPEGAPAAAIDEHLIYFKHGSAKLPEAEWTGMVLRSALCWFRRAPSRVTVIGHADSSGPAETNLAIAERRAQAVADALVGLGVDRAVVTVASRGEAAPAVATGDGVAERLNRRVLIDVRPVSR